MDKILTAEIKDSAYAKTLKAWQHNRGQILRITGIDLPTAVEVHFSLQETSGDTLVRVGATVDGVTEVKIPDEYLENSGRTSDYSIYAFIYLTDETSGITKYRIEIPVNARPKPTSPSEDPEVDPDLFRETIVAVNASADRAESALKDTKEIRDKLNVDVSEKVTRPQTAEVGQVLAVKEIDSDGKPTEFESKDMTGGGVSEEELKQAVDTALEETLKDAVPVSVEERTPLWTPESAQVGQLLRVKSKNDDGSVVLETVEMPSESVKDVRIDGTSIVENDVAEIPKASPNKYGVIKSIYSKGVIVNSQGILEFANGNNVKIDERSENYAVLCANIDYAVKVAMCDGKGAKWTAEEQKASRERQGIYDWEDIADITLEEDSMVDIDLGGNFKDLYIYINQENVTTPIIGTTYISPYCDKNAKNVFYSYNQPTTSIYINIGSIWHYNEKMTYKYTFSGNAQKETTPYGLNVKAWDKDNLTNTNRKYPNTPFIAVRSSPTMYKAGTRIVVKGVRA